jgi:hypothetical protein
MNKYSYFVIFISLILTLCSACSPNNDVPKEIEPTPTLVKLQDDLGGITGIYQTNEPSDTAQLFAFAAPYLGDPESEGVFIFSGNMEYSTPIDNSGFFQITNLSPGLYILLIGPNINEAEAYQQNEKAVKIEVFSGEYTDIGVIN